MEFVATNVFQVTYGLIHSRRCAGCVTCLIKQTVKRVKGQFNGDPIPAHPHRHRLCLPGFRLLEECTARGERSKCMPCLNGQYRDTNNYARTCRKCKICKSTVAWPQGRQIWLSPQFSSGQMSVSCLPLFFFAFSTPPGNDEMVSACEKSRNTVCRCRAGFYKFNIDSEAYECLRCKSCELNEKEIQKCEPRNQCHEPDSARQPSSRSESSSSSSGGLFSHLLSFPSVHRYTREEHRVCM